MDMIAGLFVGALATWLAYGGATQASIVGFTLSLLSNFNDLLLWWVRVLNDLEVQVNR
jgi:hypothetical protein